VETMKDFFIDSGEDTEITWPFRTESEHGPAASRLIVSIKLANLRVFETSQSDRRYKGMGTTVVAAFYADGDLYIGHVGDSRVYLLRGGTMEQITEDHSLLNDFKKNIRMSQEDEERFPYKNIIVRALGMKDTVDVDLRRLKPLPGDELLLCSDGLNGEIEDETIRRVLLEEQNLTRACTSLINMANEAGGKDNTTVVALRFVGTEDEGPDAQNRETTAELGREEQDTERLFADAMDEAETEITRDLKVELDADLEELSSDLDEE